MQRLAKPSGLNWPRRFKSCTFRQKFSEIGLSMKNGDYTLVKAPDSYPGKRYRGLYCYEHHLVWWENTGEELTTKEVIHHKNGVKTDNRFENLEKQDKSLHSANHAAERHTGYVSCVCACCNEKFDMPLRSFKSRLKAYGHSNFCCSRSCQVKRQQSERRKLSQ